MQAVQQYKPRNQKETDNYKANQGVWPVDSGALGIVVSRVKKRNAKGSGRRVFPPLLRKFSNFSDTYAT
jgi:hypothetical protein